MDRSSRWIAVLVLVGALSICIMAASVMDPTDLGLDGWVVLLVGLGVALACLAGAWVLEGRRDRALRGSLGRPRRPTGGR